jgi:hypothetical protein
VAAYVGSEKMSWLVLPGTGERPSGPGTSPSGLMVALRSLR